MKLITTSMALVLSVSTFAWNFEKKGDECVAKRWLKDKSRDIKGGDVILRKKENGMLEFGLALELGRRSKLETAQIDIPGTNQAVQFFKVGTEGKNHIFSSLPMNNVALLKALSNSELKLVKAYPSNNDRRSKLASVRNNDIAATISKFSSCNGGESIMDGTFEQALTEGRTQYVDLNSFDSATLSSAVAVAKDAFSIFSANENNDQAIQDLVAQFQRELNLQAALKGEISELDQRKIPKTKRNQVSNDSRLANAKSDLSEVNGKIPGQKKAMEAAIKTRDQKEAKVAPLRAEHAQKRDAARSARSQVNQLKSDLSNARSSLSSAKSTLSSLRSERDRLYGQINSDEYSLGNAERDLRYAANELNAYDEDEEARTIRRRMGIRRARERRNEAEARKNRLERRTSEKRAISKQARSDRDRAKSAYEAKCKFTPQAEGCDKLRTFWVNKQSEYETADAEFKRVKSNFKSARSDYNSAQARVERIRREAREEAQAITARLQSNYDNARYRVEELESRISNANARINSIESREIPAVSREISAYEAQIPNITRDIADLEPVAARKEREFAKFKSDVNWDRKVSDLSNAQSDLDQKTDTYNSSVRRKDNLESTIAFSESEKIRLANLLAAQQARSATAKGELAQVTEELKPYVAKRAELDQASDNFDAQMRNKSAQYTSMLAL